MDRKKLIDRAAKDIKEWIDNAAHRVLRHPKSCTVTHEMPEFPQKGLVGRRWPDLYRFYIEIDGRRAQVSLSWYIDTLQQEKTAGVQDPHHKDNERVYKRSLIVVTGLFREQVVPASKEKEAYSHMLHRAGIDEEEMTEKGAGSGTEESIKRPRKKADG